MVIGASGSLAAMPSRISRLKGSPAASMRRAASANETSSRTNGILALMIRCISFLITGRSASVKVSAVVVVEEEEDEEEEGGEEEEEPEEEEEAPWPSPAAGLELLEPVAKS